MRIPGSVFTVPTVYSVSPAVATIERPGSAEIRTAGSTPVRAHAARVAAAHSACVGADLPVHVGDAQAAADDELGQAERSEERAQHLRRLLEGRHIEDLAPDVGMHAHQLDPGQELERGHRLGRGARCHREPEFGVLPSGADELMGVGLDAGGDPNQHPGTVRSARGRIEQAAQPGDLVEGVDDDATDAARNAAANSSSDLLLPCRTSFSAGTPAESATWSSPPDATSRCMPSS